jgi:protease I
MFEDIEYTKPVEAFKKAGHTIVNIGFKKNSTVKGKKAGTKVIINKSFNEISIDDFDAVFVPGGYSPDKLRVNEVAVRFIKDFVNSGKPVFSICHAPQLLITAQVLEGRRITGWKSITQDIKNAGAEFVDQEVVIDRNLISSRSPDDLPAFIKTILEKLKES